MPGISEIGSQSQLAGALGQGIELLDQDAEVTFTVYRRVVLPLDGYVFWSPAFPVKVSGSLHWSQDIVQNEDETLGLAAVTFTTPQRIVQFSELGDNSLVVARIGAFRYAFSSQGGYYEEAKLWHYSGHSIYPAMASQLLDDPSWLDTQQPIVSNSLPFWLQLNDWSTPFGDWLQNTGGPDSITPFPLPIYPSDLSLPNKTPPYVTVHIGPEDTSTYQPVAYLDSNRSSWQLCRDHVRLTIYGLQNNAAIDFEQMILQYMQYAGAFASDGTWSGNMGLVGNGLTVRDGKRNQTELKALAMQKFIDVDVSYNQARVNDVARTLIEKASFALQLNQAA